MLTICIVFGILILFVSMEVLDARNRKKNRETDKNKKLTAEYRIGKSVLDSTFHHKDESAKKMKEIEKEIAELEESEKYFSDLN